MKTWDWTSGEFAEFDVDSQMIAIAASAAARDIEAEDGVVPGNVGDVAEGSPFVIPLLIPEGVESGDGRKMDKDSLTTRDLPISLLWQPSTGDGHNGSFIVGRIDSIERLDNGLGNARGVFDTGPYGREAERLVAAKMLRGVSADLDKFEATVDGGEELSGENFEEEVGKIKSEKLTINKARVMAATLVPKPAFQECTIELANEEADEESNQMADGIYEETPPGEDSTEFALSSLAASAAPVNPPRSWFDNPELSTATPLTVDDDGRVYGHIATWETNHIGYNQSVRPPRSRSNYAYFRTGVLRTEEGEDVAVGQLTLAGGHAPLDASAHKAVQHYDDTASAIADVACGEDSFGIWVSGGLRPGVTADQVRVLRASAPSGDWRPINNTLELVAVCQVNVPGFPIARARVASGSVMSLVAAGASTLYKIKTSQVDDLEIRLNSLEQRVLSAKKAELAAQVETHRQARLKRLSEAAAQARAAFAPELDKRAQAAAELAAKADEYRSQFKMYVPNKPDFKEELHPRDDDGKFRHVLGKLSELMKGDDQDNPDVKSAQESLTRAADLEESGDLEGATKAAGDAAQSIEKAAEAAETSSEAGPETDVAPGEGDAEPKARLSEKLHDVAAEIGEVISTAAGVTTDAVQDAVEGDTPADDIPEEFKELLDKIVDEIGEGVDPTTVVSRMDNKLRHWLEGKGFQSPEQLIGLLEKLLQRPIQPGITQ